MVCYDSKMYIKLFVLCSVPLPFLLGEKKTLFSHNRVKLILCENLLHGAQIAELLVQVILAPPTSAK